MRLHLLSSLIWLFIQATVTMRPIIIHWLADSAFLLFRMAGNIESFIQPGLQRVTRDEWTPRSMSKTQHNSFVIFYSNELVIDQKIWLGIRWRRRTSCVAKDVVLIIQKCLNLSAKTSQLLNSWNWDERCNQFSELGSSYPISKRGDTLLPSRGSMIIVSGFFPRRLV